MTIDVPALRADTPGVTNVLHFSSAGALRVVLQVLSVLLHLNKNTLVALRRKQVQMETGSERGNLVAIRTNDHLIPLRAVSFSDLFDGFIEVHSITSEVEFEAERPRHGCTQIPSRC